MRYVLSESLDPYFNLAAEEYLLKQTNENIFMLWRSVPSVIVGKHQNALAEINYPYVLKNNLVLARRLSGGGTVVHDQNNVNFTFISNGKEGKLIDFKKFVSPVIDFLKTLDIEATLGDKNDIRIGNLKISGNAEHVFKKRVLHHGTLLFNSDLSRLKEAIKILPGKYFDKAVQSNRSSVTNIIEFLEKKISVEDFIEELSNYILKNNKEVTNKPFSENEKNTISHLSEEKYAEEDWVMGYSPKYEFKNSFLYKNDEWDVSLKTEKGQIIEASLKVNNYNLSDLSKALIGCKHNIKAIRNVFTQQKKDSSFAEIEELSLKFF
jgi:lipoate-protein ligase A